MTERREDIAELVREIRQIFERRDLGVYEKKMAVAALLRPHVWPVESLRSTLMVHWLSQIECNHYEGNDSAICACGWKSDRGFNVGKAVELWIDHVFDLAALPSAPHVWEWIPVGERIPEFEEPVWGLLPSWNGKGYALAIVMRGDGEDGWLWHICDESRMIEWPPTLKMAFECDDDYRVKYWMPLAALPSAPLSLESSNQK